MVVENWQQAERGLDFIRAELEGRATFLVHPEPNGNGIRPSARAGHRPGNRHRRAAERFPAPHQRLQRPRHRPAAARLAVLPGRGPRRRAAPVGGLSAPLFPAARRPLLPRPHRDRRQEIRRRPAGHEARSARAGGHARKRARPRWMSSVARLDGLQPGNHRLSKPNWNGCAPCSRRAKRTAWRSITKCASWATTWRAPTRGFRWRAWSWSGCGAMPKNRPNSANATAPPWRRRSGCAPNGKRRSKPSGRSWRSWKPQAAAIGEEHAATRAELAGLEERHRGEARRHGAASSSSGAKPPQRRDAIAPEIERLGEERARLLADNIELDQPSRRAGRRDRRPGSPRQRNGRAGCRHARSPARRRRRAEGPARRRAGKPGEALADRSRAGAQAGRTEVPRRDQPQGTELPGGGAGRRPTIPFPMPTPSPRPSRQPTRSATASKRWAR